MKIVNIYGQPSHHIEAKIVGTRDGLLALQETIKTALEKGNAVCGSECTAEETVFASDGEGYKIIVECDELDTWHEDEVICPWCGLIFADSWEMNDGEHECDCGKKFELEVIVERYYSTSKKD